ncbi:UPF0149 family protein [Frateuria aurantia]
MSNEPMIGYDELAEALSRLRLGSDPSEFHGSLSGFLAGGARPVGQTLLEALQLDAAGEIERAAQDDPVLLELMRQTEAELADPELAFEPLHPSDDRPLPERADALASWCRGFLGGFGLSGAATHSQLSEEAQEILRDLATIASSEFDFGPADEDEDALIEVFEFVRVGAMLLHAEVASLSRNLSGSVH